MSPTGENELQESVPSGEQAEDTFIGWRYVDTELLGWPEGRRLLRPEDLLHPAEDDKIVQSPRHSKIVDYLMSVLEWRLENQVGIRVVHDAGIDFERPDKKFSTPDVAVLEGSSPDDDDESGRIPLRSGSVSPLLVMEVTSPGTRRVDLVDKFNLYYEERVPVYVIVDIVLERGDSPRLLGYTWSSTGYTQMEPDSLGRIPLGVGNLCLALGSGGARGVVCTDATTGLTADKHSEIEREREKERAAAALAIAKAKLARKRSERKAAQEADRRPAAER